MPLLRLELAVQLATLPRKLEIPWPPFELAVQLATLPSAEILMPLIPFCVAVTCATTACVPPFSPEERQPEMRR